MLLLLSVSEAILHLVGLHMQYTRNFYHAYRRTFDASTLALACILSFCVLATGLTEAHVSGQGLRTTNTANALQPNLPPCSRTVFPTPSTVTLDDASSGLITQIDSPTLYHVYGNTDGQLLEQLQQCSPGASSKSAAEFTGQTDYSLTWQYNVDTYGGQCTLTNVKVGLHTAVALPYWQPTSDTTAGLAEHWQHFEAGLLTHEDGHVAIDKVYAAKLALDMESLESMPCDSVARTIHAVTSADTSALNRANSDYDTQTDHGATQGATLPTS